MTVQHLLIEASGLSDTSGAHGKLASSHQFAVVNSRVEVLAKTFHTILPLSAKQ